MILRRYLTESSAREGRDGNHSSVAVGENTYADFATQKASGSYSVLGIFVLTRTVCSCRYECILVIKVKQGAVKDVEHGGSWHTHSTKRTRNWARKGHSPVEQGFIVVFKKVVNAEGAGI